MTTLLFILILIVVVIYSVVGLIFGLIAITDNRFPKKCQKVTGKDAEGNAFHWTSAIDWNKTIKFTFLMGPGFWFFIAMVWLFTQFSKLLED